MDSFEGYSTRIIEAMDDDLNTADAIGVLFELVRAVNTAVEGTPTKALAEACRAALKEFTGVLGLLYQEKETAGGDDAEIEARLAARTEAKQAKNWAEADRIRDQLKDMGIELKDTPNGVQWKRV